MVDELAGILFALDRLSKVITQLPGASTEQQEEILSEIEKLNCRIELIALLCEHAN